MGYAYSSYIYKRNILWILGYRLVYLSILALTIYFIFLNSKADPSHPSGVSLIGFLLLAYFLPFILNRLFTTTAEIKINSDCLKFSDKYIFKKSEIREIRIQLRLMIFLGDNFLVQASTYRYHKALEGYRLLIITNENKYAYEPLSFFESIDLVKELIKSGYTINVHSEDEKISKVIMEAENAKTNSYDVQQKNPQRLP